MNVTVSVEFLITLFTDQVNIVTVISTSFVLLATGVLLVILALNLNDSEFVILLF